MCVLIFPAIICKIFLILRKTQADVVIIYVVLCVKCPLFLPEFYPTGIFSTHFRKYTYFMNIRPVAEEMFHRDGLEAVNFRNICERP